MAGSCSKTTVLLILVVSAHANFLRIEAAAEIGTAAGWVRHKLALLGGATTTGTGSVDGKGINTAVVAKDGTGNFTTIGQALEAAPPGRGWYGVFIKAGVYEETVNISRHSVVLWGEGIGKTIITGRRYSVRQKHTDMPWTATVTVTGHGFIAQDLTIQNTAGPLVPASPALALRSDSNKSLIHRCRLEGHQDTLWAQNNLQFYLRCDIAGTVDFVFGNAMAVFQECRLLVRRPPGATHNVITGQGRDSPGHASGFVFHRCNVTAMDGDNLTGVDTYLGRPWKNHSRVVFMESYLSSIVNLTGWVEWDRGHPVPETTKTVEYLEYGNTGPGAKTNHRVNWTGFRVLTAAEASRFTVDNFINGNRWVPSFVNGQQINYTRTV
ncbi:probable pectinesterase/pectinesterase inhibitor 17 [Oryza brachyantha]|uniref:Pectinesterase n=1 Tax=Oryza brachyantha TaxID=4533 RepID=J3MLI6_ORYBR|nr:probable pectinesterase/pectinesterase inhibitor 17 [Oryza brachyantha]